MFSGVDGDEVELPGDTPEIISVYFSPDPGNHRVIAVSFREAFKTPRNVAPIIDSIEHKYPKDITFSIGSKGIGSADRVRCWRYDQRMRLMSKATAGREWGNSYSRPYAFLTNNLPESFYEQRTVALDAGLQSTTDNDNLTSGFGIVLYDESAMYRSVNQSAELFKKFKADQVQKQADSSKDSSAPVKF
jgi:hypothetical protein